MKFHTENPKILRASVPNLVAWGELAPGICAPLLYKLIFIVSLVKQATLPHC